MKSLLEYLNKQNISENLNIINEDSKLSAEDIEYIKKENERAKKLTLKDLISEWDKIKDNPKDSDKLYDIAMDACDVYYNQAKPLPLRSSSRNQGQKESAN